MKDILVSLNNAESLDSCLMAATRLADRFDVAINGMFVKRLISYEIFGSYLHPELYDEFEARQNMLADQTKKRFAVFGDSINSNVRYIEGAGDVLREVIFQSGANDLVIVGQTNQESDSDHRPDLPADIALACGRPVMVVPELSSTGTIGRTVLVAWNGTRESTRALHDSMPILQAADYINVVTFSPEGEQENVVDIASHLDHYGVTYDITHSMCADAAIPAKILKFIEQFDSDLLVMGAYGHNRLQELVLGGVSRSLFRQTKIPLLVSH